MKNILTAYILTVALTCNILICDAASTWHCPNVSAMTTAAQKWAERNKFLLAGITTLLAGAIIWQYTKRHSKQAPFMKVYNIDGTRFTIKQGLIEQEQTNILVNAANQKLQKGSGVCGAIFQAAGAGEAQMINVCNEYINLNGEIQAGEAYYTNIAYPTPSTVQGIIHAVSPSVKPSCYQPALPANAETAALLKKAYESALKLASLVSRYHPNDSIAFPLLGSGAFGFHNYDKYDALDNPIRPALEAIVDFAKKGQSNPKDIRLVLFTDQTAQRVDHWFREKYPDVPLIDQKK